jgi:hypothetical protein
MKLPAIILCMLIGFGAMTACGPQQGQYDTIKKSDRTFTSVQMHWVAASDINQVCSKLGASDGSGDTYTACALSDPQNPGVCDIYTVEPDSFDDTPNVTLLGHEMWHCLGAKHK